MGKYLNRDMQNAILEEVAKVYPEWLHVKYSQYIDDPSYIKNGFYLEEHRLVELRELTAESRQFFQIKITAEGLDFIEEDGGLSAILNVVTVKFDVDTVKQMMLECLDENNISSEERGVLEEALSIASEETLKEIFQGLIQQGLKSIPNIIGYLSNAINPT